MSATKVSSRELALRRRHRDDFFYYAPRALKIRTKEGSIVPFQPNRVQHYLHARLEEQRKKTGKVRALILKGRQQGCSTYVEGRFYWKTSHGKGKRAFILTHMDDATANLFDMTKRYHDSCPPPLKPSTKAANAKELLFDKLDSGFKVSTAGSKGTGRSSTIQFFHGSEVAFWPGGGKDHVGGALQAVADAPGTEVILESTAFGREGLFFEWCMKAHAADKEEAEGKSRSFEYTLIFIPWYWQEEYRKPVPADFEPTSEEEQYMRRYGCDLEQITWRRGKIAELEGAHHFRREYPATVEEAFSAEIPGALWTRERLEKNRHPTDRPLPQLKRIVVAVDPSGGDDPDKNDEQGIIAAGIDVNRHCYVLRDVSGHFTPQGWGTRAVVTYHSLRADRIVGEANFGGAMVENTIKTIDRTVAYKAVTASRGKLLRAEPVAALDEQGLIHLVGHFDALEDELVTWKPGMDSPNRLDAMVWAITELALGHQGEEVAPPIGVEVGDPFAS